MHTCFELRESPLSCDVETLGGLLFLLAQLEIKLTLTGIYSRRWHLKSLAISVALVLTVHEDIHGEPWRDVATARDVDLERYVGIRNSDEGLDAAVCVAVSVLFDHEMAGT